MKTYTITFPAFTSVIEAKNDDDALEQFWFNYDVAQDDPDWGVPIISEAQK